MGQYEEAIISFENALRLNPRRYPTMLEFAKLLLPEHKEAEIYDSELLRRAERSGDHFIWVTRHERARQLLHEAARLNPMLRDEVVAVMQRHNLEIDAKLQ